ncbi:MAG: NAD(P)H-dependent oxidoreductase subunit E [Phycisphaerae bacterium]
MAWKCVDRNLAVVDAGAGPVLTEGVRAKIRSFFDRYETKRAVLLPALHVAQDAVGHISPQVMLEVAELLELAPSDVFDTVGFYTQFWTHPKGQKVVVCCRSVSCMVMGANAVLQAVKDELGIEEHETTADGRYSLMTEECLAGCDHAPCLLINEKLHKRVRPGDVPALLKAADNDKLEMARSDLFDAPQGDPPAQSDKGQ